MRGEKQKRRCVGGKVGQRWQTPIGATNFVAVCVCTLCDDAAKRGEGEGEGGLSLLTYLGSLSNPLHVRHAPLP